MSNKTLKQLLLEAPDRQLDASMFSLIEKWDEEPTAIQILEVADKCACFSLASGFMMVVLNGLLDGALKKEGYESLNDFRSKVTQPWLPLV